MTRISRTNKRAVKKSTPEQVEARAALATGGIPDEVVEPTYRELQAMAKGRGLKANGSKADLLERLA